MDPKRKPRWFFCLCKDKFLFMLSTFFFTKKKKDCKKEVGERAARPLSIRLCTFCADKLIKIETQVCLILTQTLELSKISCYFYKFILKSMSNFYSWTVLLLSALSERLDGKIRFVAHAPRALPLIRIRSLSIFQMMGKVAGVSLTDEVCARLNFCLRE